MNNYENWNWAVGVSADNGLPCVDAACPETGRVFEVCEVWGESDDKEVTTLSMGNAHVLAAAKELHEALEEIVNTPSIGGKGGLVRARKALAKARGEAS